MRRSGVRSSPPAPIKGKLSKFGEFTGKSWKTGSGKTVAFGLAIAPELLSGDLAVAAIPRALIIAPTRELALQVHRELEWLYELTGAVIVSCVGGMDIRSERRALELDASARESFGK